MHRELTAPVVRRPSGCRRSYSASRYQSFSSQLWLSQPLSVMRSLFDAASDLGAVHERDHDAVLDHQLVHANEERRALDRIELALGRPDRPCRTRRCASGVRLRPCHLFAFDAISHEQNWFMKNRGSGVLPMLIHLRGRRRTWCSCPGSPTSDEKYTDAMTALSSSSMPAFWQACLMICWRLLARRVDRGLEDELELLAVLRADAVGAALPAGGFQDPVRLVDVEFPLRVRRPKLLRVVEEVARRRCRRGRRRTPGSTRDRPAG